MASSTPPRLETASQTSTAPVGAVCLAIASTSWTTPVEVSDWVTKTAAVSAASAAAPIRAGSSRSPHSWATCTGSIPYARTSLSQRSPKLPADATTTRSPGESRLATADSIAAVPEPVKRSTSCSVANRRLRAASVSPRSARKSGLRWWCSGAASAATTSGGIGVGPGVIR